MEKIIKLLKTQRNQNKQLHPGRCNLIEVSILKSVNSIQRQSNPSRAFIEPHQFILKYMG